MAVYNIDCVHVCMCACVHVCMCVRALMSAVIPGSMWYSFYSTDEYGATKRKKKGFMRFVKKYGFISMRKNFFTFLEESEARARERQRARSTEIESES